MNDAAYDEELLFAAAVMHDLGLGEHARGQARFEVEGADLAAAVLRSPRRTQKPTSTGFGRRSRCTRPTVSPSAAVY